MGCVRWCRDSYFTWWRAPRPLKGKAQNYIGELVLQRRVPGLTSDEAPQIVPIQPRASHPECQPSPHKPGCCADVPRNGAEWEWDGRLQSRARLLFTGVSGWRALELEIPFLVSSGAGGGPWAGLHSGVRHWGGRALKAKMPQMGCIWFACFETGYCRVVLTGLTV